MTVRQGVISKTVPEPDAPPCVVTPYSLPPTSVTAHGVSPPAPPGKSSTSVMSHSCPVWDSLNTTPHPKSNAQPGTPPPAVDRALTILEVLAQSTRGLRLPEIALRLGLPKSSAHSLLVGLERRGYLQRSDTSGRYRFGLKILSLATAALCGMTLRDIAFPVLTGLMRSTGLAAKMAILDHDQAVLIEQVHPPHVSAPMTWLGRSLDLHCTALGKVLAAFQPGETWAGG